jgi:hypothetical protein
METFCIMMDKRDNPKNVNGNLGNWFHKFPTDGSSRRGKKASLKARKKLSKSHTGKIPWNKGKKIGNMSEEQKRKISNTLKGKKVSLETRKKLSLAAKKRQCKPRTDEYKKKQSEIRKKILSNMTTEEKKLIAEKISKSNSGKSKKPHTEEWKKNISNKLKGIKRSKETKRKLSEKAKEREAQKKVKEAEANKQAAELDAQAAVAKAEGEAQAKKIRADADAYEARQIAANQQAYQKQWDYEIALEKAKRWNGKEVPDAAYIVPGTGAVIPLTTK